MAKVTVKKYMVVIYANYVRKGIYAISAEDADEGQKVVPEAYQDAVTEYLISKE